MNLNLLDRVRPKNVYTEYGDGIVVGVFQDGIDSQLWVKVKHGSITRNWLWQDLEVEGVDYWLTQRLDRRLGNWFLDSKV